MSEVRNAQGLTFEEYVNAGVGGFECLTDGFIDYLAAPWAGEATIITNDHGLSAVIFTDRDKVGGAIRLAGDDGAFASPLAGYWQESFDAGKSTGDIFDQLCVQYGVTEVWEIDNLTTLVALDDNARILGYGPYENNTVEERPRQECARE
ncbi:hypothetical protein [Corynebacterium renale]|uniref:Uncharacterized protein n=1 Tax=Corynebacterium renale TaxID=1724 RepID=A0A2A9DSD9_9CORY|nr:hypothetical protein [Corynebacterium renale]PFG28850.1 hypothetical protein ATK06_1976 [Corynebacterium renale]SQI25660.1 Uncharacterised protein [Corynebacterium renale]